MCEKDHTLVTRGWARGPPPPAEPSPPPHAVPRPTALGCVLRPRAWLSRPRGSPVASRALSPGRAPRPRAGAAVTCAGTRPFAQAPGPGPGAAPGARLAIFACLRAVPGHGHRDVSGTWRTLDRRLLLPPVITGCIWGSRGRHRPFFEDERYPWKSRPWDRRCCAEVAWDEGSSHPIPGLGPR